MSDADILEIVLSALAVSAAAFDSPEKVPTIVTGLARALAVFAKASTDPESPEQQKQAGQYIHNTVMQEFGRLDIHQCRKLFKGTYDNQELKKLGGELILKSREILEQG